MDASRMITFVEQVRRSGYNTAACCIDGACYLSTVAHVLPGEQYYQLFGAPDKDRNMAYSPEQAWLAATKY